MTLPKGVWLALLSLVTMVVGAVGPWAKVLGIVTINGTHDGKDGWIVVGCSAVALLVLVGIVLTRRWWLALVVTLAGGIAGATAGYDISDINSSFGGRVVATAQWGIYVALAGSIALVLSSLELLFEVRRAEPAPPAPPEAPPAG